MAYCSESGRRVSLPKSQNLLGGKTVSEDQAARLQYLREEILTQLQVYNDIISEVIGRDDVGDIIQATIVAGCPFVDKDGSIVVNSDAGNAIIEIISSGQPVDTALTAVFMKIDGIDGESGEDGGSSGSGSGGCHDEDAGV